MEGDVNPKIAIFDTGSLCSKVGLCGAQPKIISTEVVDEKKVEISGCDGGLYIGDVSTSSRKIRQRSTWPIEHGVITNWECMEKLYAQFFSKLDFNCSNGSVLIAESALPPKANREKLAEIMFEKFNVASFFSLSQAVLALYSVGHRSGLVLNAGAGVLFLSLIHESLWMLSQFMRVML